MGKQQEVVALIGSGKGPNIPTFGLDSSVRVKGLNGGVLLVRCKDKNREEIHPPMVLQASVEYDLPDCAYMSAECDDADDTLIVSLVRS